MRYGRDLFRAEGVANSAEPEDAGQTRFFVSDHVIVMCPHCAQGTNFMQVLFHDVSLFSWLALIFHSGLVLAQHVSLSWSSQWYMLLSETILLFANYYSLFKVTR